MERRHCKELAVASLGSERLMGQLMGHVEPCRMKINLCQTHLSGDTCHLLSLLKEACSLLFLQPLFSYIRGPFPDLSAAIPPLPCTSNPTERDQQWLIKLFCIAWEGGEGTEAIPWHGWDLALLRDSLSRVTVLHYNPSSS